MTTQRRLFLCVDCGGTKTAAVITDEAGNVVARGSGGPSNFMDVGETAFLRAVKTAVEAALSDATGARTSLPSPGPLLSAAWFGISGCDSPASIAAIQPPLSSLLSLSLSNLIIANDSHLLASPLSSHPTATSAVVVIAGTGSNCMSFKRQDGGAAGLVELGRSGGWGWILGDEGSGFYVGRTAVRYILTQWDRASVYASSEDQQVDVQSEVNPATNKPTLRARIFSHFEITSPPDLFSVVYTADPPPLHASEGASANAPPPSPGTVVSNSPSTTPDIVVEPANQITLASPPKPKNGSGTQTNPNIFLLERKHRLTSLTPLIFSSAFDDNDPDALKVLRISARSLAENVKNLLLPPEHDGEHAPPKAVRAEETLLCFGGSLVGIKKYRALIVDELGRIRKGLAVGEGEAKEVEDGDEGRGVVAGVVFVGDAAVSGAVGLASGFSG